MNYIKQIVNTESLSNLFLDFRYCMHSKKLNVFYLDSSNLSASLDRLFPHFGIKGFNLKEPTNLRKYIKLNHQGQLFGYGIKTYDAFMIDSVLTKLSRHQIPNPSNVRKFNDRLFYLNCTGQNQNDKRLKSSTARSIYQGWLTNGQLIDLKNINHQHLKVLEAYYGMTINYLRPINKIKSTRQMIQIINHGQRNNKTILRLLKTPDFQTALRFRKRLVHNSASHSINFGSSLNKIIINRLAFHQPLKDSSGISYRIPGLSSNYLDRTLCCVRQEDRYYHLNHRLVSHFLPVYNVFKNLQSMDINSMRSHRRFSLNLNIPYVGPEGKITNLFTSFNSRFQSRLVNFALLKHDQRHYQAMNKIQYLMKKDYGNDSKGAVRVPKLFILKEQGRMVSSRNYVTQTSNRVHWKKLTPPQLFIKSPRSREWLINPRYRIKDHSDSLVIHLDILRDLIAIKLNCFGQQTHLYLTWVQAALNSSASKSVYSNFLKSIHQIMITKLPNLDQSIQLIRQLMIWTLGETLTLAGGKIIQTNYDEIKVKGLPKAKVIKIISTFLKPLLISHQFPLITKYHYLNGHELWHQIKTNRQNLLKPDHYQPALRFFQIIPRVKRWRHRYLFVIRGTARRHLGLITRCFLIKGQPNQLLRIVKVTHANWYRFNNDVNYHNSVIDQAENGHSNGKITCYPHINKHQNVYINSRALSTFTKAQLNYLYHYIDLKSYFKLLKATQP